MSVSAQLAEFASNLEYGELPSDVRERTSEVLRDVIGVSIAGAQQPAGENVLSVVTADTSSDGGPATVLAGTTGNPGGAALANGTFAEALAYDDTFERLVIHPSATAFPAAFTAAELTDASGPAFLGAYVTGIETTFRLGRRLHPEHYERGWHSTGTIGAFGAAAAAGSLFDLSTDELRHAFGIAGSASSSLRANGGTMTFALHAGHAAQSGLRAARLASNGFTGSMNIFEGELGYESVTTPERGTTEDPEDIDEWGTLDLGLKAYPCARVPQAAMDAVRRLRRRNDFALDDVDTVRVQFDPSLAGILDKPSPTDVTESRGSIEFCVAAVLRDGDATPAQFSEDYVRDGRTRSAMAIVEPTYDEELGNEFSKYGARVLVELTTGETLIASVETPPGSPDNPLDSERQHTKFRNCAGLVFGDDVVDELIVAIDELDSADSLDRLQSLLRRTWQ